ncbi:MAG: hypothetical protein MR674_04860, partial [Erysipelotrichaceae bacterium]|nr:hypothetical protein [Erysipelotrichaceae bacterium]
MIDKLKMIQTNIRFELNKKLISEIYVIFIFIISIVGWLINSLVGISILVFITTMIIVLTNDLKFIIPEILFIPFIINSGFSSTEIPI